MMKKIFIRVLIVFCFFYTVQCTDCAMSKPHNAEISKIEMELFGFDYVNDELKNRVARLEKSVYGKESLGDLNVRIKKISTDILSEQIGQEITPVEDTFSEEVADNTVNYPIVDEIEMKLFNQTYKNRDFHTRIVTIEKKLFKKIYDAEDYSMRMDRIKAEVMPERLAREKVFGYDNSDILTQQALSGLNKSRFSGMYGQENYTRPYTNYGEYQEFTGSASPINSETLNDELAQLEYNTFGTEFSNEDTKTRIKRLNSVNKAKKSSAKYDSQKFNQRMSTVMEIGAMLLMILAMVL